MPRVSLLHRFRTVMRATGLDVRRWPSDDYGYSAFRAMTAHDPDVILDVGANDGGFAKECRNFGFTGRIVSFEPGSQAYQRLALAGAKDPNWETYNFGLGRGKGIRNLHIAGNAGASSSFLPMTVAHENAAPDASYTSSERVEVKTLDDVAGEVGQRWRRPALKIDAQGSEQEVLDGASRILPKCSTVRLELSLTPLYEGAWSWLEAIKWFDARHMELVGLVPGFSDPRSGRLLQFDGVFARRQ